MQDFLAYQPKFIVVRREFLTAWVVTQLGFAGNDVSKNLFCHASSIAFDPVELLIGRKKNNFDDDVSFRLKPLVKQPIVPFYEEGPGAISVIPTGGHHPRHDGVEVLPAVHWPFPCEGCAG
jgi:hypothetical protein